MFSNRYIFIYASVMIIIVALVLSFASTLLQPYQAKNVRNEKMRELLLSAGIDCGSASIEDCYNRYVQEERIISSVTADDISVYAHGQYIKGDRRAFDVNVKEELSKISKGQEAMLPLYVMKNDAGELMYVIPLYGKGLWGPIWGSIALKEDLNTVAGVMFSHKSETPGLGAEIATREFQQQFIGKHIMNDAGEFVSIKLVKGGVRNNPAINPLHGVDAISGGTITSNGTTRMIYDCLKNYLPYFQKILNYERR